MKYKIPNELIDLLEVISVQDIDVNKHSIPDYDIDVVLAHASKNYEDQFKLVQDTNTTPSYSPDEYYRVVEIKFNEGGKLAMFSVHHKIEGHRIITEAEYKKLTQTPEEKAEEERKKATDDKPIDLSEIPF